MPPRNMRGGKAYKKKKKPVEEVVPDGDTRIGRFEGAEEGDQDYARVLRMLGDRRVVCFCNDGSERMCKIRQALCKGPKRQKIEVGDIVLISFRDFGTTTTTDRTEVADLIDKYSRAQWRDIRRQKNIHANLFASDNNPTDSSNPIDDIFADEGADTAIAAAESSESEGEEEEDAEVNIDAI